jgi:O-acetyl-ADP-ribose deacetylase (regulator of RNase III)
MNQSSDIPQATPMITYVIGDIFRSPAKVLVNTVNTKGVMGKGLAKDFKALYPEMFLAYQRLCDARKLDVGHLHLFQTANKWILNFPTKNDWKHPSRPAYIEAGLKAFVNAYARANITSIAFPQLGCGHGELDWETDVQPIMEKHLSKVPIQIFIHLYRKDVFPKEHHDLRGTKAWLHSEPESLGFQEVWEDLSNLTENAVHFSTANGESFTATTVREPEEAIRFSGIETFDVPKETVLDVWQYFRSAGFLTADNLPQGLASHGDMLLTLLGRLPYVSHVQVARGRSPGQTKFAPALQLTPRAANDEPLFRSPTETVVHA